MTDSEIGIIATAIGVGIGAPLWRAGRAYAKRQGDKPAQMKAALDATALAYKALWVIVFLYATWYVFIRPSSVH